MELKKVSFGKGGKSSSILGAGVKAPPVASPPPVPTARPVQRPAPVPPSPAPRALPIPLPTPVEFDPAVGVPAGLGNTLPTSSRLNGTSHADNHATVLPPAEKPPTTIGVTQQSLDEENQRLVDSATEQILDKASEKAIVYIIEYSGTGQDQATDILNKYKKHIKGGVRGSTLAIISKDTESLSKRLAHANTQRSPHPLCVLPFASKMAVPRVFYGNNLVVRALSEELEIVFLAALDHTLFTIAGQDHFILDAAIPTLVAWLRDENSQRVPVIESVLIPMEEMTRTLTHHYSS